MKSWMQTEILKVRGITLGTPVTISQLKYSWPQLLPNDSQPRLASTDYCRVSSANNCFCLVWGLLTTTYSNDCSSKSKSVLYCDQRSFGLSILVSVPVDQSSTGLNGLIFLY
jgi:hypothetical protein